MIPPKPPISFTKFREGMMRENRIDKTEKILQDLCARVSRLENNEGIINLPAHPANCRCVTLDEKAEKQGHTEVQAIKNSIAHWERMIEWVKGGNVDIWMVPYQDVMQNAIGESWNDKDCSLCNWSKSGTKSQHSPCPICPLAKAGHICSGGGSLWQYVNNSTTWVSWIENAEVMLKVLKSLLPSPKLVNVVLRDIKGFKGEITEKCEPKGYILYRIHGHYRQWNFSREGPFAPVENGFIFKFKEMLDDTTGLWEEV